MFERLAESFPEIESDEFIERRNACWELALNEGELKQDYRRSELKELKKYFFTGEFGSDMCMAKYPGTLAKMFPIQREDGYDFYYHQFEFDSEMLGKIAFSSLIESRRSGMDEDAQLAFWDYHLGNTFSSQGIRHCKNGPVEFTINPSDVVGNILGHILDYFLDGEVYARFFAKRLNYLFEAFAALKPGDEALSREKTELKLEIFQMILNCRKDIDPTDERIAALNEFEALMESTPGLPPVILAKWKQAKAETKS